MKNRISFLVLAIVLFAVSLISIGCGSGATGGGSGGSSTAGKIYICAQYIATGTSEILSLDTNGNNVKQIATFEFGTTLESMVMPPDNSVVVYEYFKNSMNHWGYVFPTGTDIRDWRHKNYCVSYLDNVNYGDYPPYQYYITYVSFEGSSLSIFEDGNNGRYRIKTGASFESYPVFSNDGGYIADSKSDIVTAYNGSGYTADLSSILTGECYYPSFSPSTRETIAFVYVDALSDNHIAATTEIAGILRTLGPYPKAHPAVEPTAFLHIYHPLIWSDDGQFIHFSAIPTDETEAAIYRLDVYGSGGLTKISGATSSMVSCFNVFKFKGIDRLFYVKVDDNPGGTSQLCSMNFDGSDKKVLLSSTSKLFFFNKNMIGL